MRYQYRDTHLRIASRSATAYMVNRGLERAYIAAPTGNDKEEMRKMHEYSDLAHPYVQWITGEL